MKLKDDKQGKSCKIKSFSVQSYIVKLLTAMKETDTSKEQWSG